MSPPKRSARREELAANQAAYEDGLAQYNEELPEAEQKISDAEKELADAREARDSIDSPLYTVYNRREIPGSEGYTVYATISEIVDAIARIFPYFLYFVAALVTFTTMTRMVDEERINAGTLKALGYDDRDVIKKFSFYGAVAGLTGTVIGVLAGHTLLPLIVWAAYAHAYTTPLIELHVYPGVTLLAFAFCFIAAVSSRCHRGEAGSAREARGAAVAQAPCGGVEDSARARGAGVAPPFLYAEGHGA